jgi:hypothetical protein
LRLPQAMSTLVYVHGTNGSGKSTLARAVLAAAGGAQGVQRLPANPKATWTPAGRAGVVLAGKYGTACGGVDGIQPYADLYRVLMLRARAGDSVFAEGLVTPGQDTCVSFAKLFTSATFILLDTPTRRTCTRSNNPPATGPRVLNEQDLRLNGYTTVKPTPACLSCWGSLNPAYKIFSTERNYHEPVRR